MQVEPFLSARRFVVMGDTAGTAHHHSYRAVLKISGEIDERTGLTLWESPTKGVKLNAAQAVFQIPANARMSACLISWT
jgi:hypothetical protein